MKKGIIGILLVVLLAFSVGSVAIAGFDLSGEFTYDMDTEATDGSTEIVSNLDLKPLDLTFTWNRVWLPSTSDSLKLNAELTAGIFALNYERELLESDAGEATLSLTKEPLGIEYVRSLDGVDSGTITVTLTVTPLTLEYVNDFDEDASGTIKLSFEKSF